jgi:hypothetical protein
MSDGQCSECVKWGCSWPVQVNNCPPPFQVIDLVMLEVHAGILYNYREADKSGKVNL